MKDGCIRPEVAFGDDKWEKLQSGRTTDIPTAIRYDPFLH